MSDETKENGTNEVVDQLPSVHKRYVTINSYKKLTGIPPVNMNYNLKEGIIKVTEFENIEGQFIDTEKFPVSAHQYKPRQTKPSEE